MEHLPIHLPREAELGGPVQYRWMYPFERYMFHLKKKVKNMSRVEGSIVAQKINEETSTFSSHYFSSQVLRRATKPGRYDDGGERPSYPTPVPDIFAQIGRLFGKRENGVLDKKEYNHIHKYILTNCEDIDPYMSIFREQLKEMYPHKTSDEVEALKDEKFTQWLPLYISNRSKLGQQFPTWLVELANGPATQVDVYPSYCTRGYVFQVRGPSKSRSTVNNGVLVRSDSTEYYGVLKQILVVEYPGLVNLRCVMFRCDWYNPIVGVGLQYTKFGVTEVNSSKKLRAYDPFVLASQADQVCYIRYPRFKNKNDPWITVSPINPRGRVIGVTEQDPLQQITVGDLTHLIDQSLEEPALAEEGVDVLEDWNSEEEELSDFASDEDSASSTYYSSDSN